MEKLKNALKVCSDVAEKSFEALEDGKVSVPEGLGIGMKALGFINVVKDFPEIKEEYTSLTDEQKVELSAWFADEFDIVNDSTEFIIEQVVTVIVNLGEVFDMFGNK